MPDDSSSLFSFFSLLSIYCIFDSVSITSSIISISKSVKSTEISVCFLFSPLLWDGSSWVLIRVLLRFFLFRPCLWTLSLSKINPYLSKIRFHIEKNKVYPKVAKRLKQTGKVHVKFVISKNGEIKHYKVHKNSPFENLDKAALEILEKIAKFEPIPEKLDKDSWEITVPIVYQIARN